MNSVFNVDGVGEYRVGSANKAWNCKRYGICLIMKSDKLLTRCTLLIHKLTPERLYILSVFHECCHKWKKNGHVYHKYIAFLLNTGTTVLNYVKYSLLAHAIHSLHALLF